MTTAEQLIDAHLREDRGDRILQVAQKVLEAGYSVDKTGPQQFTINVPFTKRNQSQMYRLVRALEKFDFVERVTYRMKMIDDLPGAIVVDCFSERHGVR